MDISAKPIATAMGKGRDDQCEAVGQDSFPSPNDFHWSTVSLVRAKNCGGPQPH